jgi:hypothetical protein
MCAATAAAAAIKTPISSVKPMARSKSGITSNGKMKQPSALKHPLGCVGYCYPSLRNTSERRFQHTLLATLADPLSQKRLSEYWS